MTAEQPDELIDVHPDLAIAVLLALIENKLEPKVQMDRLNVVHIFLRAVARPPHKADDLPGLDRVALF